MDSNQLNVWVVTDIDGTLMDHNYDLQPALKTLRWLKKLGIPVIPCTSKTASEVELLRREYNLHDPYIVENGGAIYGSKDDDSNKRWELILGRSYKELRTYLDIVSDHLGFQLTALTDLSYTEITQLTGLSGNAVTLACKREWSVPFLNPPSQYSERIRQIAFDLDLKVLQGNRMSHLLSKNTDKGIALQELKLFLKNPNVKIIALGDSPNDLALLQAADISIVVPSSNGPHSIFLEQIHNGTYLLAPAPHAEGWSLVVTSCIKQLDSKIND